jgi:hypothetical protein
MIWIISNAMRSIEIFIKYFYNISEKDVPAWRLNCRSSRAGTGGILCR